MARHQPFQITGYHSCDKQTGIRVLTGALDLRLSNNTWDWLGGGIYFWEHNPNRALEYAIENANGYQFNKVQIKTPFVLGANIELGNCLNLVESESLAILIGAYHGLVEAFKSSGKNLPVNVGNNRKLDCAVIRFVHQSRVDEGKPSFDSVRSAFDEGEKVYEGASFASRSHLQVCVINPDKIKGYFLPRPIEEFNPYLNKDFVYSKN
jgi:hypothetical protein